MVNDALVEIEQVDFYRDDRKIFDKIDIAIPRGKVTAIMGPSGTGKTTLIQMIGGQLKPASGTVKVDGRSVCDMSKDELYALRKEMGMLFQSGALISDMSVYDNVAFPLREHTKLPERLIRHLVIMKLHAVGLRGAENLMPSQLSGGMSRRAALARAIALDPTMIMYDEPFTGQDPISMGILLKLIRLLNDALGLTSIVVSHDVQETAAIADYLFIIAEGKVVAKGSPAQLKASGNPWVQQFIHGMPDGPVPFRYPAIPYEEDLFGKDA